MDVHQSDVSFKNKIIAHGTKLCKQAIQDSSSALDAPLKIRMIICHVRTKSFSHHHYNQPRRTIAAMRSRKVYALQKNLYRNTRKPGIMRSMLELASVLTASC